MYITIASTLPTCISSQIMPLGAELWSFFSSYRFNSDYTNYILFKDCTWDSNSATLAAAVDIVPDAFQSLTHGLFPQPVFENCTFVGNILLSDESGILNFHFFEVRFTLSVTFVHWYCHLWQ